MNSRSLSAALSALLLAGCAFEFASIPGLSGKWGGSDAIPPQVADSLVDVTTIAGKGTQKFAMLSSIAVDRNGVVFVGDQPGRIHRIMPDGRVETIAGAHEGFADGDKTAARFRTPRGLAIGTGGDLVVSDSYNNRIRKIAPDGTVSTIAGSGERGFSDGTGTAAMFDSPADVEVDAAGRIYVADLGNKAVRKIEPNGDVTTLARGEQIDRPDGLAFGPDGTLYVAEGETGFLRKVAADGAVSTIGNFRVNVVISGPGFGGFNSSGPFDVAVDRKGRLLVGSADRILRVKDGKVDTTLAGFSGFETKVDTTTSISGNTGPVDGPGHEARFAGVNRFTFGPDGALYVAEIGSNLVRKVTFRTED